MSHAQISHSTDLKRLRDEGYEVEVYEGFLLIHHVPYVNAEKKVVYGILVSPLQLSGDITARPSDHVAKWVGDHPWDSKGSPLLSLVNQSGMQEKIREGVVVTHSFSHKPPEGYADYHQKMTRYIDILEGHAHAIDPDATAKTFPVVGLSEEESVFCYLENASSLAGITAVNGKLKKDRIAIVGLGGTGSYILDFVAKTPVGEIHLFDGDTFLQHNAFRSPGAPSRDDLANRPTKVAWLTETYSRMRRKIIPHPQNIDESNVVELKAMDYVFVCIDKGEPKRTIVKFLIDYKIPFTEVGMDLFIVEGEEALDGSIRVTTCTPTFHDHVPRRIHFNDGGNDEYSQNIQIADMNALNATLAVIKWKKLCGFYKDFDHEHHMVYSISTSALTREEAQNEDKDNQA